MLPADNLFERIEKPDKLRFGQGAHIGNAKDFIFEVALAGINDVPQRPQPIVQRWVCHPFGQIVGGDTV